MSMLCYIPIRNRYTNKGTFLQCPYLVLRLLWSWLDDVDAVWLLLAYIRGNQENIEHGLVVYVHPTQIET